MMNKKHLARALGGEVTGGHVLCPGPGHSPRDRSLAVFIDPSSPDLFRTHSFAGDDFRACRDYVKARLGVGIPTPSATGCRNADTLHQVSGFPHQKPSDSRALEIWSAAVPIHGTIAETYLANRNIMSNDALRFHPRCPFRLEDGSTAFLPAMVGLFRDIVTDKPAGIHRTAIRPEGSRKADIPGLGNPKKMLGPAKGAGIKLSPDDEVLEGLGICKGIETGLSIVGAGWRPIWALGSAGAVAAFPLLAGVESLTIFADRDLAGIKAARECQGRWLEAGRECRILAPPVDGHDWNDEARA
jgi:hypothetical protein